MNLSDIFLPLRGLLSTGQTRNSNYYTTQIFGNNTPIWVDTTDKFRLYNEIPELQAVINRYAKMVASANPIVCDKDGNKVDPNGHWIFKVIDRPNPLQSWGAIMYMTAINKCITNNALIYAPKMQLGNRAGFTPIAFNNVQVVPNKIGLKQISINGMIKEFKIPKDAMRGYETFTPSEVIYLTETDGINLFDTNSRIDALRYPLSNLKAQYKKRNVLLENVFALGVLSGVNDDGISQIPIDADEIKTMREDLKNRHSGEVVITDKKMSWQPMTFPTKDLMLFEEMTADKIAIIDSYGLNQYMFGSGDGKGATFSNVEMGERMAYNSTVIPDTEIFYDEITQQTGLDKDGLFLKPSFEHISVLQSDKTKDSDALLKRATAMEKIMTMVTLSDEEIRDILGL